jgi:hypothetical protein
MQIALLFVVEGQDSADSTAYRLIMDKAQASDQPVGSCC